MIGNNMIARQKTFLVAVAALNATLWAVPSDVIELIARDKHTLCGRYSREHFTVNVVVLMVSLIALYIDRATGEKYRRRWFQVIATILFVFPPIIALDWLARGVQPQRYVHDAPAYHRPPNVVFTSDFEDLPEAARTYPNAPAGFGMVTCDYRTDQRGYRNRQAGDRYDIVVLGDSFAEGSKVSDDDAWPVRLADKTGGSVYNLGMSGYSPVHYLASLEAHGLGLSPRRVLCMLYEGNDFRAEAIAGNGPGRSRSKRFKSYVKQSPLRQAIDRLFIAWFAPIGAGSDVAGADILSWLPLAVPEGPSSKYYAFAPKQLLVNRGGVEGFRASRQWRSVSEVLLEMHRACTAAGAELVIVYAPTKAHVMLPLVRDGLPPDKVRAFAALRAERLPEGEAFLEDLFSRLPASETVVRRWCASHGVGWVSVTESLRRHASAGSQVYYTYDQHWTPGGHEVVAEAVQAYLETRD